MRFRDRSFELTVTDWPNPGSTSTYLLDPRIFADTEALEEHCRRSYGDGALDLDLDDGRATYRRRRSAPGDLLGIVRFLLNRSVA